MKRHERELQTGNNKKRGILSRLALCMGLVVWAILMMSKPENAAEAAGHTHVGVKWVVTKQPTCTSGGHRVFKCSCGHVMLGEDIPAKQHNWKVVSSKAATCTETGYKRYHCYNGCNGDYTETIAKKPHVGTHWETVIQPTCTTGGKKEFKCSCGHSLNGETIPATGHNWRVTESRDSTCTQEGYRKYHCYNGCNGNYTETIAKKPHVGTHWKVVREATCTTNGVREFQCDCGHAMYGEEFPGGHLWQLSSVTESTCTKEGKKVYVCRRENCRETKTESMPLANHKWEYDHTVEATCSAGGRIYYHCANPECKETYSETTPIGNHSYRWVILSQPTSERSGLESYRCEYCEREANTRKLYLISYNANGGTNPPETQIKREGIPASISANKPTKPGCVFLRWATSTDGNAHNYRSGATYDEDSCVSLLAIWDDTKVSVVSRDDGIWYFPVDPDQKGNFIFTDWAGCSSTGCYFHPGETHFSPGCHSGAIGHNGVDLRAKKGDPVYAAANGTVVYRANCGARGLTVIMEHRIGNTGFSYYSVYQHLSGSDAEIGVSYGAGVEIAKAGNSGGDYPDHLHFSILLGEAGRISESNMSYISNLEQSGWVTAEGMNVGMLVTNPKSGNTSEAGANAHCGSVEYTTEESQVTDWSRY